MESANKQIHQLFETDRVRRWEAESLDDQHIYSTQKTTTEIVTSDVIQLKAMKETAPNSYLFQRKAKPEMH